MNATHFSLVISVLLSISILGCDARKQERQSIQKDIHALGSSFQQIRTIRNPGDAFYLVNEGYILTTEEYKALRKLLNSRLPADEVEVILMQSSTCWPDDPEYWPSDLDQAFLWPNGRPNKARPESP
ncbi:MAG: hypothetical protein AAGB26_12895 [Planctomycetota bacterium]